MVRTSRPYTFAILANRSPKYPATGTTTRSPGENMFATDDSRAPVPDDVNTSTSFVVRNSRWSCSVTSRRSFPYPGPRWYTSGCDCACNTCGGTGTGPGAMKISGLSMRSAPLLDGRSADPGQAITASLADPFDASRRFGANPASCEDEQEGAAR